MTDDPGMNDGAASRSSPGGPDRRTRPLALRREWWIPLAFVALAIVCLSVTPVVVATQVRRLRTQISEGSDQARVRINDLEAAFALELLARADTTSAGGDGVDAFLTAYRQECQDEVMLDSLVQPMGGAAVAAFVELRTLARQWHQGPFGTLVTDSLDDDRGPQNCGSLQSRPTEASFRVQRSRARPVLMSAQRLDRLFEQRSMDERARIHRLEQLDVRIAQVLAPLALAAMVVISWIGVRTRDYAHAAELGRVTLARVLESKATLMRGITHDLKNPLGAAAGYAELLADGVAGPLAPEQYTMVQRISRLTALTLATVSDLLEISRADTGNVPLEWVITDLAQVVCEAVEDHRASASIKAIDLQCRMSDPPFESAFLVTTDPHRVRQILDNLLSNAIKYTPRGGAVDVSIGLRPERPPPRLGAMRPTNATTTQESPPDRFATPRARIAVHDSGPGIPPAYRDRVFEEFFRVPGASQIAGGTGVGLAISRRLARALGGDLTLERDAADDSARGSTFALWLPLAPTTLSQTPILARSVDVTRAR